MNATAYAVMNAKAAPADEPYGATRAAVLDAKSFAAAFAEIASWPGYAPTPLWSLRGLARELDLAAIHYKDERGRFGLKSFKALGGAYAVANVLRRCIAAARPGTVATSRDLVDRRYDGIV